MDCTHWTTRKKCEKKEKNKEAGWAVQVAWAAPGEEKAALRRGSRREAGELEPETEKMLGLAVAAVAASRAAARAATPDCPSRAGKRRRQRGSVVEGRR
jgi:hypothetical protein